jgi:transposase
MCHGKDCIMSARPAACPSRNVKAEEIEAAVWGHVAELLASPDRMMAQFHRFSAAAESGTTRDRAADQRLRARLDRVARADKRLLDAYQAGAISLAELSERRRHLHDERLLLERQQREADELRRQRVQAEAVRTSLEAFCDRTRARLDAATFADKQAILQLVVERIIVGDGRLEIRHVIPLRPPQPGSDGPVQPDAQLRSDRVRQARQQLSGFLLRHGCHYRRPAWTKLHRRWLAGLKFEQAVHHLVLEDYVQAIEAAQARRDRLTAQIAAMLPDWTLAPVVAALQAMRGMALVNAATLIAELGDLSRFANPRQLMAYLGLVPSEHSSGASVRRGGLTKAGNSAARRLLIEAAWCYRFPARVSRELLLRQEEQPKPIREIAWKAQVRLCARYRRLARTGKPATVVTAAIARELAGFVWAIARSVPPAAN